MCIMSWRTRYVCNVFYLIIRSSANTIYRITPATIRPFVAEEGRKGRTVK
jgi:hypothetical protein